MNARVNTLNSQNINTLSAQDDDQETKRFAEKNAAEKTIQQDINTTAKAQHNDVLVKSGQTLDGVATKAIINTEMLDKPDDVGNDPEFKQIDWKTVFASKSLQLVEEKFVVTIINAAGESVSTLDVQAYLSFLQNRLNRLRNPKQLTTKYIAETALQYKVLEGDTKEQIAAKQSGKAADISAERNLIQTEINRLSGIINDRKTTLEQLNTLRKSLKVLDNKLEGSVDLNTRIVLERQQQNLKAIISDFEAGHQTPSSAEDKTIIKKQRDRQTKSHTANAAVINPIAYQLEQLFVQIQSPVPTQDGLYLAALSRLEAQYTQLEQAHAAKLSNNDQSSAISIVNKTQIKTNLAQIPENLQLLSDQFRGLQVALEQALTAQLKQDTASYSCATSEISNLQDNIRQTRKNLGHSTADNAKLQASETKHINLCLGHLSRETERIKQLLAKQRSWALEVACHPKASAEDLKNAINVVKGSYEKQVELLHRDELGKPSRKEALAVVRAQREYLTQLTELLIDSSGRINRAGSIDEGILSNLRLQATQIKDISAAMQESSVTIFKTQEKPELEQSAGALREAIISDKSTLLKLFTEGANEKHLQVYKSRIQNNNASLTPILEKLGLNAQTISDYQSQIVRDAWNFFETSHLQSSITSTNSASSEAAAAEAKAPPLTSNGGVEVESGLVKSNTESEVTHAPPVLSNDGKKNATIREVVAPKYVDGLKTQPNLAAQVEFTLQHLQNPGDCIEIGTGNKSAEFMAALTRATEGEWGLVRTLENKLMLIRGGPTGVRFTGLNIGHVLAHTHYFSYPTPSRADMIMLVTPFVYNGDSQGKYYKSSLIINVNAHDIESVRFFRDPALLALKGQDEAKGRAFNQAGMFDAAQSVKHAFGDHAVARLESMLVVHQAEYHAASSEQIYLSDNVIQSKDALSKLQAEINYIKNIIEYLVNEPAMATDERAKVNEYIHKGQTAANQKSIQIYGTPDLKPEIEKVYVPEVESSSSRARPDQLASSDITKALDSPISPLTPLEQVQAEQAQALATDQAQQASMRASVSGTKLMHDALAPAFEGQVSVSSSNANAAVVHIDILQSAVAGSTELEIRQRIAKALSQQGTPTRPESITLVGEHNAINGKQWRFSVSNITADLLALKTHKAQTNRSSVRQTSVSMQIQNVLNAAEAGTQAGHASAASNDASQAFTVVQRGGNVEVYRRDGNALDVEMIRKTLGLNPNITLTEQALPHNSLNPQQGQTQRVVFKVDAQMIQAVATINEVQAAAESPANKAMNEKAIRLSVQAQEKWVAKAEAFDKEWQTSLDTEAKNQAQHPMTQEAAIKTTADHGISPKPVVLEVTSATQDALRPMAVHANLVVNNSIESMGNASATQPLLLEEGFSTYEDVTPNYNRLEKTGLEFDRQFRKFRSSPNSALRALDNMIAKRGFQAVVANHVSSILAYSIEATKQGLAGNTQLKELALEKVAMYSKNLAFLGGATVMAKLAEFALKKCTPAGVAQAAANCAVEQATIAGGLIMGTYKNKEQAIFHTGAVIIEGAGLLTFQAAIPAAFARAAYGWLVKEANNLRGLSTEQLADINPPPGMLEGLLISILNGETGGHHLVKAIYGDELSQDSFNEYKQAHPEVFTKTDD